MRAALVALLLCATPAAAENLPQTSEPPKKLSELDGKRVQAKLDKKKLDRELEKRIGKPPEPVVNVTNTWTDETLVVGQATSAGIDQPTFNSFLRCHYTGQPRNMDLRLLDVLRTAASKFQSERVFVVSGFRAPKYNLMLRKKGREVARDSQHTHGSAVDFRIPGVPTKKLLKFVKTMHLGGVGFYPDSKFVHADTGPVRYWEGR